MNTQCLAISNKRKLTHIYTHFVTQKAIQATNKSCEEKREQTIPFFASRKESEEREFEENHSTKHIRTDSELGKRMNGWTDRRRFDGWLDEYLLKTWKIPKT